MAVSYGTYTITEVQEGSQIWTTTVAPEYPSYTFTVSNLIGDSNASVKVGDIIMYSYYRYTVLSVSADGTTVFAGNRQGFASTVYQLIVSPVTVVKDKNGIYSPYYVTLTAKSKTGTNTMGNYHGRFRIETTTDNENWEIQYTSTLNEPTVELDFSELDDIVALRCSLYASGGTNTLLDQQVISVVTDGVDGNDAYTVILTNENHTFAGNTTSAIASEIECNVIAYKGTTQIAATIGTITGQPTGMTTSLLNNGTVNAAFRVSVTSSMVAKNGVLNVPITVDNKVFTKKFTYGLALDGEDGKDGGRWYSGTSITGTSTTATVFSGSGISSAVEGDMYLNTSTYNTYRCTLGGDASTAKWIYVNNIKGVHGDTGKGVSSITNQYYLSTSNTTQIGGSWSTTVPPYVEDCYYWTKSHIVWTDNTETDTTAVLDNGLTDANANAIDARKVATNYLAVDNTGIMVADMQDGEQTPSTATGRNVFIDNDSVDIRNGTTTLASFTGDNTRFYDPIYKKELATFGASGAIIGANNEQRFVIEKDGIKSINNSGATVFSVNSTEGTVVTEAEVAPSGETDVWSSTSITLDTVGSGFSVDVTFYNKSMTAIFAIEYCKSNLTNVKVNSVNSSAIQISGFAYGFNASKYSIDLPPFTFTHGTAQTTTYTITASFVNIFGDSYDLTAVETVTYDGAITITLSSFHGKCVRTSGNNENESMFLGLWSKVAYGEIYQSSAYTKAPAMTFGTRGKNAIMAPFSVTMGESLYANNDNQLSIGRYNLNNDEFFPLAFAIGNGANDTDRSNAFNVDWDGNVENMGDLEVGKSLIVEGSADNIPNITINKKSTNATDYLLCEDENRNPKFRVLNNGSVIVGTDLVVRDSQYVDKNLTVTGIASVVGNLRLNGRLLDASSTNNPLFKIVTVTRDKLTISYNNGITPTIAVGAAGYTPIAFSSYQIIDASDWTSSYAHYTWALMGYINLSGSNITCYIGNWNTGGSALRIKLTFKVLCIKSSAL
jgi:hypothetical protein